MIITFIGTSRCIYGQPSPPPRSDMNWSPLFYNPEGPNSNGATVSAIGPNGNVYIAGNFYSNNTVSMRVTRWDGSRWDILGDRLQKTTGNTTVKALSVDNYGNVYVGGDFDTAYNSNCTRVAASRIVMWNAAALTWESVGLGVNAIVNAISVDMTTNDVYVGGDFTTGTNMGGGVVQLNRVSKWNATTNLWESLGEGVSPYGVTAVAADMHGGMYAGGFMLTAANPGGGIDSVNGIAHWNGAHWETLGRGLSQPYPYIKGLVVGDSGHIVVAGYFASAINDNGANISGLIAEWDGNQWSSLSAGISASGIEGLASDGSGSLYILYQVGGAWLVSQKNISGWTIIAQFPQTTTEILRTIAGGSALPAIKVYVGGLWFNSFLDGQGNVVNASNNVEWDGTTWENMVSAVGVFAFADDDRSQLSSNQTLYVGGDFTEFNGATVYHIAKVNASDGTSSLENGVNGTVRAIAVATTGSADVYVGGEFTAAQNKGGGTVESAHIVRWSNQLNTWEPLGKGVNGPVYAIGYYTNAISSQYVFVGGDFDTAFNDDGSVITAQNIVRWNIEQRKWENIGNLTGGGGSVRSIGVAGGTDSNGVYVGGSFTTASDSDGTSISASNIIFWWGGLGGYESHWLPVGQGVNGEVRAIKFRGSYGDWPVWVGGNFTTETNPDGSIISSPYAAIWDRNAHQWVPMDRGLNGPVNSIQRLRGDRGNAVVLGGEFTHATPQIEPYNHIIIHDVYGPTTFNEHWVRLGSGTNGIVNVIHSIPPCHIDDGEIIYVGGMFTAAGNKSVSNTAVWNYQFLRHTIVGILSSAHQGSGGYAAVLSGRYDCAPFPSRVEKSNNILEGDTLRFRQITFLDSIPTGEPFGMRFIPVNNPSSPIVFDDLMMEGSTINAMFLLGVDDTLLYAANPEGRSIKHNILLKALPINTISTGNVQLLCVNAVTDAPMINIVVHDNGAIASNLSYSGSSVASIPPAIYTFDVVRTTDNAVLGSFPIDLNNFADQTVIIAISGFLNPSVNQSGSAMSLDVFETDIPTGVDIVDEQDNKMSNAFRLHQNYPNPFNPLTVIHYQLPVNSHVVLRIYNVLGQEVTTVVNEVQAAGFKSVKWDASNISSGVYFYKLVSTGVSDPSKTFSQIRKMVLIR